jgi:carboxylesterase
LLRLQNQPAPNSVKSAIGVLLLHGLTGSPSEMKPVAQALKAQGYQVVVPVLAGHGGHHQELLASTWMDWLDSARQALLQLREECEQVFVAGLSMSTLLAVNLAAELPVDGIILCSTTYGHLHKNMHPLQILLPLGGKIPFLHGRCYWTERPPYGLKDERLQRIITRAIQAAKKGQTANFGLFRTYVGSLEQVNRLVKKTKTIASQAKCPVLIIHSLEDTIAPIENATALYADLGSTDKQLKFIRGCDHVMTVDLKKQYVAECFVDFVARVAHKMPEGLPTWQAKQEIA